MNRRHLIDESRRRSRRVAQRDHAQVPRRDHEHRASVAAVRPAVRERPHARHVAEGERERVRNRLAVVQTAGLLQLRHAFFPADSPGLEIRIPLREVFDRREHAAVADDVELGLAEAKAGRRRLVADGPMRNQLRVIVAKLGVRHPERLEDVVGRVVAQRLPGRALDDHRQQRVAGVAVQKFVARREVEILLTAHEIDELRLGEQPVARPPRQCEKCEVVAQPARVMEQLPQRDRRAERRDLRHPPANPVVERQTAFLGEQDDAHRRELLGQRGDVEPGRRRDRRVVLEVGHAVPLGERELSVAHDSDRASRRRRRAVRRKDGVHPSVGRVELRQPRLRTG